ncbi:MAG: acyl-CoA dehydrogenase C-terminal domain-containing protein [Gammaproteobacteria bacterium]|nr:acyl-CoA dehydrogenase C-terminal domain-containing protein [Gammaproteobacteria bacterium]
MSEVRIPLRDIGYVLWDVLDFESHFARLEGVEVGKELVEAILDEAARFSENELAPINRSGDEEGCLLVDGVVTTPSGFADAYRTFIAAGWAGISGGVEYGGQGLPPSISLIVEEIFATANMAWTMYSGLSRGAIEALEAHGTEVQKQTFLPKLLTGEWTGTMCLTEPHCGSDVGLLKTRAEANGDGSYRLNGTKIFISAGDHDLSENILHLVLARLPDAPAGTKGISMFLVPKILDERPNGVICGALEEKMGIHGNATCVLHFEDALGYLVGPENEGMRCMFTMMNGARLIVGVQGLCGMEAGFQAALAYAGERLQMRALSGPKAPDKPADPIIVHPDIRRMLLTQKAFVEGGRAMAYYAVQLADTAQSGPQQDRAKALRLLDLITPVVKAFLSEKGYESVNHAVQIFGGHGFIRETGVEQLIRDVRITLIYEGTTQIQALDLLGRKVLMDQGKALMELIELINEEAVADGGCEEIQIALKDIAAQWGEVSLGLGAKAMSDPEEIGAAAVDYLMFSGYVVMAYLWAKMARISAGSDEDFHRGKVATAEFFFKRLLPQAQAHRQALLAGAPSLMTITEQQFSHH